MSDSEDNQNNFTENSPEMDSGTCPERTDCDPSSYSSHGLPKAATRQRNNLNSDEEDSDFLPKETSTPLDLKEKAHVRKLVRKLYVKPADVRAPSFARQGSAIDEPAKKPGVKKARKRVIHVTGRPTSMYEDPKDVAGEEEIPADAPPPPPQKNSWLMPCLGKLLQSLLLRLKRL